MSGKIIVLGIMVSVILALAGLFLFSLFCILISGGGPKIYHTISDPIRDSYVLTGNTKAIILTITLCIVWILICLAVHYYNLFSLLNLPKPTIIIPIIELCVFFSLIPLIITPAYFVGSGIVYNHTLRLIQDNQGIISFEGEKPYQITDYAWLPLQGDKFFVFRKGFEDVTVYVGKERNTFFDIKYSGKKITDDLNDLSSNLYIVYNLTEEPKMIKITPDMIRKYAKIITKEEKNRYSGRDLTRWEWPYTFDLKEVIKEENPKPVKL